MRCDGVRTANSQNCGSAVLKCKECGHQGCNQGSDGLCSKQGFKVARCKNCGKLGTGRMIKDESAAQAAG